MEKAFQKFSEQIAKVNEPDANITKEKVETPEETIDETIVETTEGEENE